MNCPNCKKPFAAERGGKFHCVGCGWFEKVDNEWRVCEEPAPEPKSPPKQEPKPAQLEPSPAALEPDPAALEPDPARPVETLEDIQSKVNPPGVHSVKEILGGLITITEVDE